MQSPAKSSPFRLPVEEWAVWAARVLWLVVAVGGGAGFGEALGAHSRAVQLTGTSMLWIGWAIVAITLAIPSALGLTIARMIAPIGVVVACAAAFDAGASAATAVALASTSAAALAMGSAEFGRSMVQASAYGDEQRFVLRPPAAFYAPTAASWIVLCTSVVIGPLALAARSWIIGVPVSAAAVALAAFLLPRFHRLSRRWVVLVPAGFVLHDHVVLAETVMFPARTLTRARLALADTQAADLTGPAGGHAVEVALSETATAILAGTRSRPGGTALHVLAFLVSPTRPGRLLHAIGDRSVPVG